MFLRTCLHGKEGALSLQVPEQILLFVPRMGLKSQVGEELGLGS